MEEIFISKPYEETFKEVELLVILIEKYWLETEEFFPDPDPIEVLKFRTEQNIKRNKDLVEMVGGISVELLIDEYQLTT